MGNNDVLFVHKVERNFMKFSEKVNSPGPLNILFFYLDNFAIFHHSLELPITLALLYFFIVLITFYHDIKHFYYVFVCLSHAPLPNVSSMRTGILPVVITAVSTKPTSKTVV